MVRTYKTREEKELAVIQALLAPPEKRFKTLFVCRKEQTFYDINDIEAGFIFLAIENPDYVVKIFKKGNADDDKSNAGVSEEVSAGDSSENV